MPVELIECRRFNFGPKIMKKELLFPENYVLILDYGSDLYLLSVNSCK